MRTKFCFSIPHDVRCMLRCLGAAALVLTLSLGMLPNASLSAEPTDVPSEEALPVSLGFTLCAFSDDLELELLARVLAAEVGERSYAAQTAYGAMLVNRLADPRFPSELGAVIGDAGLRAADGDIPARSLRAARSALLGVDPTAGALYCREADGIVEGNALFDGLIFSR